MKPPSKSVSPQTNHEHVPAADSAARGWYLYGITTRETAAELAGSLTMDTGEPLLMLAQDRLVAIVRPVPLAEFSAGALQARAQDFAWLEAMARDHNQVVARIHQAGPVLPVKFGSVYPDRAALQAALAEMHDALLAQLQRLEGCDEWGVRLYADRLAVERLAGEDPPLQRLKEELAAASPGRAYLLKRKLADTVADLAEQALRNLAQGSYARLAGHAVAGQISPRAQKAADEGGEREVLHAAFLVQRANTDDFLQEMQRLVQEQEGLRCDYSGPWPPYSFARLAGEETP
jgi:hypothetical protein